MQKGIVNIFDEKFEQFLKEMFKLRYLFSFNFLYVWLCKARGIRFHFWKILSCILVVVIIKHRGKSDSFTYI